MYNAYYSKEAKGLAGWALSENNRIKASRIMRVAQNVEERYRKAHPYIVADLGTKPRIAVPTK